jgi:Xaa-Pro aminopeptidase
MAQQSLQPIDYQARRERVASLIGDGALLVLSQPEAVRNSDVEHLYRQESFLYYLTGFEEPESALLLLGKPKDQGQAFMFLRERDDLLELWNGRRLGTSAATTALKVDKAIAIEAMWSELPELLKGASKLHYHFGFDPVSDLQVIRTLQAEKKKRGRSAVNSLLPVYDAIHIAGLARLRKDAAEIERMRAAATVTKKTFDTIYATVRPGMTERDVNGIIVGEFMKLGSEMEAYGAIVAAGANACCLHYRENRHILNDGELLLIDAGSQVEYYASDVTRTFPIGKSFTPEQKAVYEIVLQAQLACIDKCQIGSNLVDIHDTAVRVITSGLCDIGLLKGSIDSLIEKQEFKKFYPHGTCHWLGMDVHDVGDYLTDGKPTRLDEGMVFTVEPGIYIDPKTPSVPKSFLGIGVRIEDDILMTKLGPDVLTKDIPKSVKELENRF